MTATAFDTLKLARRLQGAISNVKMAAERDIDNLNLQIDSLQQERDDLGNTNIEILFEI